MHSCLLWNLKAEGYSINQAKCKAELTSLSLATFSQSFVPITVFHNSLNQLSLIFCSGCTVMIPSQPLPHMSYVQQPTTTYNQVIQIIQHSILSSVSRTLNSQSIQSRLTRAEKKRKPSLTYFHKTTSRGRKLTKTNKILNKMLESLEPELHTDGNQYIRLEGLEPELHTEDQKVASISFSLIGDGFLDWTFLLGSNCYDSVQFDGHSSSVYSLTTHSLLSHYSLTTHSLLTHYSLNTHSLTHYSLTTHSLTHYSLNTHSLTHYSLTTHSLTLSACFFLG